MPGSIGTEDAWMRLVAWDYEKSGLAMLLGTRPCIYQVHSRAWLRELASDRAAGGGPFTLASVPSAILDSWKALGFTHVWLMGVWRIGPEARRHALRALRGSRVDAADVCGSPFAIEGYTVDPEIGGESELIGFRQRCNQRGLRLLLDFIPNHVALDHPWIRQHPSRFLVSKRRKKGYYRADVESGTRWVAHGRDPYFPPWVDTAQLDWSSEEVHVAMREQLLGVAALCDGVRADMAMLLLPEVFQRTWAGAEMKLDASEALFWPGAIRAVRERFPDFLLIAEVYWDLEERLLEQGFDYAYDKRSYDHVVGRRPGDLLRHWMSQGSVLWARGLRFLENHDEARVASLCGIPEHRAWLCLLLAMPGAALIHHGQIACLRERTVISLRRVAASGSQLELRDTYAHLLRTFSELAGGDLLCVPVSPMPASVGNDSHQSCVALVWHRADWPAWVLMVNLGKHQAQSRLMLPTLAATDARLVSVQDRLSDVRYEVAEGTLAQFGLYMDLPAYGYHLLALTRAAVGEPPPL